MSPFPLALAVAADPILVAPTVDPGAASASLAATGGVDVAALRPFSLAIGATIAALLVGALLSAGAPSFARAISDDVAERPDLSFAVGFVAFFGLLVVVALPLIAATAVDSDAATALAGLVSFPGLFLWGVVLLVGSCLGAVAVGDRLADRLGDSSSLAPAVVIGAVVLGASQLVPVFGAVVAMGLATVAIGAVVRRRFDVDERLFGGAESGEEPTVAADVWGTDHRARDRNRGRSRSRSRNRNRDRRGGLESVDERRSSADAADGTDGTATVCVTPESDWEWDADDAERSGGAGDRYDIGPNWSDSREETADAEGDDEERVDHWEWGPETDESEDETGDGVEEIRTKSDDGDRRTW